jgi:hypothetical protein
VVSAVVFVFVVVIVEVFVGFEFGAIAVIGFAADVVIGVVAGGVGIAATFVVGFGFVNVAAVDIVAEFADVIVVVVVRVIVVAVVGGVIGVVIGVVAIVVADTVVVGFVVLVVYSLVVYWFVANWAGIAFAV